jgi:hypothetical protein
MKTPLVERASASSWREVRDLYHQLLRVLYEKEDARRARLLADRMESLLADADPDQEAILGQECRSLIHEARGDLRRAIQHRKKEVALIRKLHELSRHKPYEKAALQDYSHGDLADRLNLLATLYQENGSLMLAIKTLEESRQLCTENGIEFEAADALEDYLAERRRRRQRQVK